MAAASTADKDTEFLLDDMIGDDEEAPREKRWKKMPTDPEILWRKEFAEQKQREMDEKLKEIGYEEKKVGDINPATGQPYSRRWLNKLRFFAFKKARREDRSEEKHVDMLDT